MKIVLWIVLIRQIMIFFFPFSMDRYHDHRQLRLNRWQSKDGLQVVPISTPKGQQHHEEKDENKVEGYYDFLHRSTHRHRRWHDIQSDEVRNSVFLHMDNDKVAPNNKIKILRRKDSNDYRIFNVHNHNETENITQESIIFENFTQYENSNGENVMSVIGSDSEDIDMPSVPNDDMAGVKKSKNPKSDDHVFDKSLFSSGNFSWGKKTNIQREVGNNNHEDSSDFVFIAGSKNSIGNIIDEEMTTKKRQPKGKKHSGKKSNVKGIKRKKKKDDDDNYGYKSKQYQPLPTQSPSTDTYAPSLSTIPSYTTNTSSLVIPDNPTQKFSAIPTVTISTSPLAIPQKTALPFGSQPPIITPVIISTAKPSNISGYTPYPTASQLEPTAQPRTLFPTERDLTPPSLVPSSSIEPSLRWVTRNPSNVLQIHSESPTTLDTSTESDQPSSWAPNTLGKIVESTAPSATYRPLPTFAPDRWKFLTEAPSMTTKLSRAPSILRGSKKPMLSQYPSGKNNDMISEVPSEITTIDTNAPICFLVRDCGRSERPI
jgi:hypothetical protein